MRRRTCTQWLIWWFIPTRVHNVLYWRLQWYRRIWGIGIKVGR